MVMLDSTYAEPLTRQGAQTLAPVLLEMFGENGYAMLVDEGCKMPLSSAY